MWNAFSPRARELSDKPSHSFLQLVLISGARTLWDWFQEPHSNLIMVFSHYTLRDLRLCLCVFMSRT